MHVRHRGVVAILLLSASVAISADTLVLRDGRRVRGELIGVDRREVEFEERSGRSRRSLRIPRRDIERIELDDDDTRFGDDDRDRDRDQGRQGPPRGMRERQIGVSASEPWIDTGIDVRSGQQLYFSASGQVRWGPSRRDGPEGERNSPNNPGRPIPNRPGAALIGRIGDRDDYFFIGGESGPFRARGSGRLFLGINDDVLSDNSGSFRVLIYY